MSPYTERPEVKRLMTIATWLEAHLDIDAPTVSPALVSFHANGKPAQEALLRAEFDNLKLTFRADHFVVLTGYHSALGHVQIFADRYEAGAQERDWAALDVAVPAEVGAA